MLVVVDVDRMVVVAVVGGEAAAEGTAAGGRGGGRGAVTEGEFVVAGRAGVEGGTLPIGGEVRAAAGSRMGALVAITGAAAMRDVHEVVIQVMGPAALGGGGRAGPGAAAPLAEAGAVRVVVQVAAAAAGAALAVFAVETIVVEAAGSAPVTGASTGFAVIALLLAGVARRELGIAGSVGASAGESAGVGNVIRDVGLEDIGWRRCFLVFLA